MSAIETSDNKVVIRHLEVEDPDIVRFLQQTEPAAAADSIRLALKLGVIALRTLGTTERVDYVERRFGSFQSALQAMLDQYLGERGKFGEFFGERGHLNSTLDAYLGQRGRLEAHLGDQGTLHQRLERLFGDDGELRKLLAAQFGDDGALLRRLYDPGTRTGPIYQVQQVILDALRDLSADLGLKRAEETLKPSAKGEAFEDVCSEPLQAIARVFNDVVSDTRDSVGAVAGSKKGDFLVELQGSQSGRFTIETEDRISLTLPYIKDYMKEALDNRTCKYGVFAVRYVESLPKFVGWINEYDLDGDRRVLVCATASRQLEGNELRNEMLRIAYGWARMRAQLQSVSSEGLDAGAIRSHLNVAKDALQRFAGIRQQCANVTKAADEIQRLADELKDLLAAQLAAIHDELQKKGQPQP